MKPVAQMWTREGRRLRIEESPEEEKKRREKTREKKGSKEEWGKGKKCRQEKVEKVLKGQERDIKAERKESACEEQQYILSDVFGGKLPGEETPPEKGKRGKRLRRGLPEGNSSDSKSTHFKLRTSTVKRRGKNERPSDRDGDCATKNKVTAKGFFRQKVRGGV